MFTIGHFLRSLAAVLTVALAGLWGVAVHAQITVDPKLPDYKPAPGVTGTISSVGSDTMNNMMSLWSEGFKKYYPSVRIEIEGKGTGTAAPALIEGKSNFGPASREFKKDEIDAFEAKFGYKPVGLASSIDMLAVYVHKDNPIKSLTLPQVDAIFSGTRKLGHPADIRTWGELGLSAPFATSPIGINGRNSASGTYAYFKENALGKGDFKNSVKEHGGSSGVVQAVASDRFGIGYSGIGYKTADVRAVPLAADAKSEPVAAEPANAYTGEYPLARFLYVYVNYKPGSTLDPLRREFVKYMFSRQGQEDVVKDGYFPVTADLAAKALAQVGIQGN
jgi:phosphate transport system substrate-binding protein